MTKILLIEDEDSIRESVAFLLEKEGFWVEQAFHFKRPTMMEEGHRGLRNWLKMFVLPHTSAIDEKTEHDFYDLVEEYCHPYLFKDGNWILDYVRIRIFAIKI